MSDDPSPAFPPALAMEGVTFAYGATPGVPERRADLIARDVSLVVGRGEMVGLLGPNGAGKSTLLKLVSGALRPQDGRGLVDGQDIRHMPREELARHVAVMPQDFSVQFNYTVRQVVELGRTPYLGSWGTLRARDRLAVNEALAETAMEALADRVFEDLSGGERQRALMALALAQQAPILLMDEPTAHLDIRHQVETLDLLRRLNRERGLTVLATLHDLNLAARFFPRLIVYKRQVVADGSPTEALDEAILSNVYEMSVRVGILRGDERLSVLPPAQAPDERANGQQGASVAPASSAPESSDASRPSLFSQPPQSPRVEHPVSLTATTTRPLQAHVVAGGGSGELVMRALADAGVAFSAGPLNVGDSDGALAERLATLTLVEPPYAPISPEGLAAARERMIEAGTVIVCPAPLGPGNIGLLDEAHAAQRAGARVILLEPAASAGQGGGGDMEEILLTRVEARDFCGRGRAAYEALLAGGAVWVNTPTAALRTVVG